MNVKKYLIKNRFLILGGIALTACAVPYAYKTRGYLAAGGEWLILPVILMGAFLAEIILGDMLQIIHFEKDGDFEWPEK